MALIEEQKKLKAKIKELENSFSMSKKSETNKEYVRLIHYYYVFRQMGGKLTKKQVDRQLFIRCYFLDEMEKIETQKQRLLTFTKLSLTNEHNKAYNIAEYFYEKASKTLCQMMITLMDYVLQEKANISVLCNEEANSTKEYKALLDEFLTLNKQYQDSYFYLCAFDYSTEQIADFVNVQEYKHLAKEHIRIVENGLPNRVSTTIQALKNIVADDEQKTQILMEIEKSYTPNPLYDEALLKACYDNVLKTKFKNKVDSAMSYFGTLVIELNYEYESKLKLN